MEAPPSQLEFHRRVVHEGPNCQTRIISAQRSQPKNGDNRLKNLA